MSAPTTTHPYDDARRYPDEAKTHVDWQETLGEGMEGWTSRELVTIEGEEQSYRGIADATGYLHRIEVDGQWYDEFEIDEAVTDAYDDEARVALFEAAREAFHDAQDDNCGGQAEGPTYNEFYQLDGASWGTDENLITEWAGKLDGLPLVTVLFYDGRAGLALSGGGMDLSWEIAEAHLRLGYRVPTWIQLPAMAQGGRLGRDFGGTDPLDDDDAAIVRAVIRDRRAEAARHTREADLLAERYGITEAAGEQA